MTKRTDVAGQEPDTSGSLMRVAVYGPFPDTSVGLGGAPITDVLEAPAKAPVGSKVVLYACIAPGRAIVPEHVLRASRRYAKRQGWFVVAEFVDRRYVTTSCADREELPKALALVEAGHVDGLVAPSMVMFGFSSAERDSLARWQQRTGTFCSSPGSVLDVYRRARAGFRYAPTPPEGTS